MQVSVNVWKLMLLAETGEENLFFPWWLFEFMNLMHHRRVEFILY